jgi:predicted transcriptional regulator
MTTSSPAVTRASNSAKFEAASSTLTVAGTHSPLFKVDYATASVKSLLPFSPANAPTTCKNHTEDTMSTTKLLLSGELAKQLEDAARAQEKDPAELLEEAVKQYLEDRSWLKRMGYGQERAKALGINTEEDIDASSLNREASSARGDRRHHRFQRRHPGAAPWTCCAADRSCQGRKCAHRHSRRYSEQNLRVLRDKSGWSGDMPHDVVYVDVFGDCEREAPLS